MVQPLWGSYSTVSYKVKYIYHKIRNLVLDVYPREIKTSVRQKGCTRMFTAALFGRAQTGNNPNVHQLSEWINKLWYTQTIEYYSARKKESATDTYHVDDNLKNIILHKTIQTQKAIYSMIPFIWNSTMGKTVSSDRKQGSGDLRLVGEYWLQAHTRSPLRDGTVPYSSVGAYTEAYIR